MAAKYSRRPSYLEAPLSPSIIPDLAILPQPSPPNLYRAANLSPRRPSTPLRYLKTATTTTLAPAGTKTSSSSTQTTVALESFGGTHLVQKPLDAGTEAGTIEADEQRVRLLKDADAAIKKVWQDEDAKKWIKEQDEAGFVVAHRQVSNASYKRARLADVGNGNWEVVREVGGEDKTGKRRDSGLPIETNSKWDVVGVVVKKIVIEGDDVKLGEELGTEYWN